MPIHREGWPPANSPSAASASLNLPRSMSADASIALQLKMPGQPPTPRSPVARTGSVAARTPVGSPRAEARETAAMAALATGSTCGNRSAALRAARTWSWAEDHSPRKERTWAARAWARDRSSGRSASCAHAIANWALRYGGVPIAPAKVGIAQMGQTRDGVGRGQTIAHPGRRYAEVRDGPTEVIDVELQHAPHDQRISRRYGHFISQSRAGSRERPDPRGCVRRPRIHTPAPCAPWPSPQNPQRFHRPPDLPTRWLDRADPR